MQNLLEDLKQLLSQDENLVISGELNKGLVIDKALKLDPEILNLLVTDENIKDHFFTEIGEHLVFDKVKFQQFVNNKTFLPDSYTAYKNKIGLTSNGQYISDGKEVVLAWPYKDCVLEGDLTKEGENRNEIFINEILAPDEIDRLFDPKVFTKFKRYTVDGEKKVENIQKIDNFLIQGNNLLALHSLECHKRHNTGLQKPAATLQLFPLFLPVE